LSSGIQMNDSMETFGIGNLTFNLRDFKKDRLTEVDWSEKGIDLGATEILCGLIATSSNIVKLNLSDNPLGCKGGLIIAHLIMHNMVLEKVVLQRCGLCGVEYDYANSKWVGRYTASTIDAIIEATRGSLPRVPSGKRVVE
jgi:hypothetical protein